MQMLCKWYESHIWRYLLKTKQAEQRNAKIRTSKLEKLSKNSRRTLHLSQSQFLSATPPSLLRDFDLQRGHPSVSLNLGMHEKTLKTKVESNFGLK